MTESEAINGLNADKAESNTLANTVTAAFDGFDAADAELTNAVADVTAALASLESNVNYAKGKYL